MIVQPCNGTRGASIPDKGKSGNHCHFCLYFNFKINFTFALVFTLKRSFKAKAREAKEKVVIMVKRARNILNNFTFYTTFLDLRLAT